MPARKGLLAPQNTFLDTIATRFDGTHSNFVLGNAKIAKVYPIVYCSDGFCDLTGYSRAQIMQKSCACNFLYGQKTDVQHKEAISRALEQKQELKLEVILYRGSGTPFWCLLDIVPIQDEKHEVVLFLCSHKDITKQKLHEQQQHQLAQLHAKKQQQIADQHHHHNHPQHNQQRQQQQLQHLQQDEQQHNQTQQQQVANADRLQAGAAFVSSSEAGASTGQLEHTGEQQTVVAVDQQQKLDEADEAELTAIANQNALISMDGFDLEDSGDDNEFDDADDSEDHDKHTAGQYSRRRSRAVLYQLSGHYGYRRNVNMKSKLKLNNRMNIPEYKTTTIEKQRFILSHYGVGKSCWDWLILVVSFYVAIVVPYNATFKDKQQDLSGECKIDSIDILVEVVFVIDVILNFRTTFVNRKGEVVTRPKIICKHYIRGWFIVDACAALPFDLLCSLNLYSRSRLDLNLLKLIRLLRLARLLQKMDRYSQYSYIILTLLMLIFSLLAHWCACIWYVIAMEEIERNPPDWKIGWINQLSDKLNYSVVNTKDMASSYVTALYFTTSSLTSVGFGNVSANTNAEKIFSIVIMLIGALMHAVVFGNVTALIRVMYARRSNYQTRLRDLKDFFRLHQLPKELQQRMSDYFQTTWSLNHGIETYEILKDFPEELRGDVSLHLHREVLSLPIFETAPQGFLKSLARHIESKFCCPTEYLIHRGDALNYLYLVCNGSMEVLQDNMVVAILGKGDLVGYDVNAIVTPEHTQYGLSKVASSMLNGSMSLVKSSSDLKALTYCDLKCIQISGLLKVLKLYPEFSDTFHKEIIHDLSFNLRENHDDVPGGGLGEDGGGGGGDETTDDEGATVLTPPVAGGRNGNGGGSGRRSPPPNIGHLFRSITAGDNQIGRYDHVDADNDDDNDDGDDGDDDEDREHGDLVEEEEDEEEEDEEEDDEDGTERRGDHNRSGNDGSGGGGGGPSGGGSSNNNNHSQRGISDDSSDERSNGGDDNHNHNRSSSARHTGKPVESGNARSEADVCGSSSNGINMDDEGAGVQVELQEKRGNWSLLHKSNQQASTQTIATAIDAPDKQQGLRRRMNTIQDDWQSSHSYDGIIDSQRQKKHLPGRGQRHHRNRTIQKNNSDETVLLPATESATCAGVTTTTNCASAVPARLKSAIGQTKHGSQQSCGVTSGNRKPPLSFDLSRNTMAIVDRRRRSAGCIPRPLLIGSVSSVSRRTNGHSSLTNINEDQPMNSKTGNNDNHNHKKSTIVSIATGGQQLTTTITASNKATAIAASSTSPPKELQTRRQIKLLSRNGIQQRLINDAVVTTSYSNQDLKNIDARITGISASVKEMKQELRQELSQFRTTMQLLMQLVDCNSKQTTNNNTSSLGSQSRLSGSITGGDDDGGGGGGGGGSGGGITNRSPLVEPTVDDCFNSHDKAPLLRSQSTNSLPASGRCSLLSSSSSSSQLTSGAITGGRPLVSSSLFKLSSRPSVLHEECDEQQQPAQSMGCGDLVPADSAGSIKSVATHLANKELQNHCHQHQQQSSTVVPSKITAHQPLASNQQQLPILSGTTAHPPASVTPAALRPLSQCSSSPLSLRQSNSGANLTSDNDSGRSSSSVNSSNFLLAGNKNNGSTAINPAINESHHHHSVHPQARQLIIHQTERLSNYQTVELPPVQAPAFQLSTTNSIKAGRPVKMLLTTTEIEDDQAATKQRYTIDMANQQNSTDDLAKGASGSIV